MTRRNLRKTRILLHSNHLLFLFCKTYFMKFKSNFAMLGDISFSGFYKFVHIVPDLGPEVRHNKVGFVEIVPEPISQESIVTENTCRNINYRYIIEQSFTTNLKSQSMKMRDPKFEPQCTGAVLHNNAKLYKLCRS